MMNKATAVEERHQTLTWGAAQLGIAQGVLDCVADDVVEATQDLILLVAVWIDERATDESALRAAAREAVRKAVLMCVHGRHEADVRRLVDERHSLTNPFYSGG